MPKTARTIGEIRRELKARERELKKLEKRRAKAASVLAKVDKRIAAIMGGAVAPGPQGKRRGPGRPRKSIGLPPKKVRKRATGKPLIEYLKKVLANAPEGMRVKDVAAAAKKAGYRSMSKDFYGIVATSLRDKKVFQNLKRGLYKLK